MSEPFLAQIIMFGGNFAPRGWAFCNGQLLPISQNPALFSILGITYGGDGRTTFALPDLRSRSPIHPGTGPGLPTFRLGQRGGLPTTTLTTLNMPSHNHIVVGPSAARPIPGTINSYDEEGNEGDVDGNYLSNAVSDTPYHAGPPDGTMGAGAVTATVPAGDNLGMTTGLAGNQQSFNEYHPYEAVNFIIALFGTFPSRS
jgi:microcystin-dependent protein